MNSGGAPCCICPDLPGKRADDHLLTVNPIHARKVADWLVLESARRLPALFHKFGAESWLDEFTRPD